MLSHKVEPMIDGQIVMSAQTVLDSSGMDMTHILDNFYMRVQGSFFTFQDWPESLWRYKFTNKKYYPDSAIYGASE